MPYPQVVGANGGANNTASNTHTVNLPADIAAGDLLIAMLMISGIRNVTWPDGWSVDPDQQFAYKIADGDEGASITVDTDGAGVTSAHTTYRLTGHDANNPVQSTEAVQFSGTQPDPPNLAPSWGAADTLWIVAAGWINGTITVNAYPSNYTNGRTDAGNSTGVAIGSARRELNASSDNPGQFTLSSTATVGAVITLAIQPAPPPEGGSESDVDAAPEGAGEKTATGSSDASTDAAPEGAAQKLAQGGADAVVDSAAEGAGEKIAAGGADSGLDAVAEGAGIKTGIGDAESPVTVTPEGEGEVIGGIPEGGSEATLDAAPQGAGEKLAAAGVEAQLQVILESAGIKLASGESEASVSISPEGAGMLVVEVLDLLDALKLRYVIELPAREHRNVVALPARAHKTVAGLPARDYKNVLDFGELN